MLIIKVVDDVIDTRSYFWRLFMKRSEVTRECAEIANKRFDILSLPISKLDSPEVVKLLQINRGAVLESVDAVQNERLNEYLFDKSSYYKRALLSSVVDLVKSVNEKLSVVVCDDLFAMYDEYITLAKAVKGFCLVTTPSTQSDLFSERVYYQYGLQVVVRDKSAPQGQDIAVDFSRINADGSLTVHFMGSDVLIYPDNKYFEPDKNVLELMKYGVPLKCACAVMRQHNYKS